MKNILFVLFTALFFSVDLLGQQLQEKRIYYLDITGSMKTNGIWDSVRSNLKKAINGIKDRTTEVELITFTDSNHPLKVDKEFSSPAGKAKLCQEIDDMEVINKCHTDIYYPLEDFYQNRIDPKKINYMFLMTDGVQYGEQGKVRLSAALNRWRQVSNDNVYGFYVNLCETANDRGVQKDVALMNPYHLWQINTANVDINLVYIDNPIVYNIRNDNGIEINYRGQLSPKDISLQTDSEFYTIQYEVLPKSHVIRLSLNPVKDISNIPEEITLSVKVVKNNTAYKFTFLATDQIKLICYNKKEKVLKIDLL